MQAEFDALVARMKALPGVKDATIARIVPFAGIGSGMTKFVLAPGELPSETAGTPVWFNSVDSEYFRAMGVPLERGRSFQSQDTATSEKVAILNQTMAKRLFGGEDVIGRHLRIGRKQTVDVEIVGVARDGRYNDVTETPQPYLYLPLAQDLQFEPTLIVTTLKEPGALLPAARRAGDSDITLNLEPAGGVEGKVVCAETGQLLPKTRVALRGAAGFGVHGHP